MLLLAATLPAAGAAGQPLASSELSFANPGARSLGLGGAFVALADDATAAFANPAGLGQLTEPEISLEGRLSSFSSSSALSAFNFSGVGFFSFVYPWEKWSVAFYRHQLASVNLGELFVLFPGIPVPEPADGIVHLDVAVLGLSAAVEISESLSVGFGLSRYDGSQSIRLDGDLWDAEGADETIVAGFLWRFDERFKLGGVFREGPELDEATLRRAPATSDSRLALAFPSVYGLGAAFRSCGGGVTVSFEWDRRDDGDELHLGTEYAILDSTPLLAIRAGVWREPNNRLRGQLARPTSGVLDAGDEIHAGLGVGAAYERFQVDFGVDLSDLRDTYSISAVYFF